jgi:hypothetical protein
MHQGWSPVKPTMRKPEAAGGGRTGQRRRRGSAERMGRNDVEVSKALA